MDRDYHFLTTADIKEREPEDHSIAGIEEATRYCQGTSYPDNSDYLLFARELDIHFQLRGKNIAEFCTGPGNLAYVICGYTPETMLAIDASQEMLRRASMKHKHEKLIFKQDDLFKLRCKKDHYDLVVCQNSMHHFDDEMLFDFFHAGLDCLRPGGVFYISDYRREEINGDILSDRLRGTNAKVRQDLIRTLQASYTRDELMPVLNDLGELAQWEVYFPDWELAELKKDPGFQAVVAADPHPHVLDYDLSLRVKIQKTG